MGSYDNRAKGIAPVNFKEQRKRLYVFKEINASMYSAAITQTLFLRSLSISIRNKIQDRK